MEEMVRNVFELSMFSDIHFVSENPVTIKVVDIKKFNGDIQKNEYSDTFTLKRHTINPIDSNEHIEADILESFLRTLNYSSSYHYFRYFSRNIFAKIFSKRNPNLIIDKIKCYDWVITSNKIVDELRLSNDFESMNGDTDIRLVGKIGKTYIYVTDSLTNQIYLGNINSITPLFNREISYNLEKSTIDIEYIFNVNKVLTKLQLI